MEESILATYVLQYINQTSRSLFLTGKAGTGKTTLLKKIINESYKKTAVVAPTGIAALNAGGVTIHSLFQIPPGAFIPIDSPQPQFIGQITFETRSSLFRHYKMQGKRKSLIRNLELLIIDEVSMLRADLLDAVDTMLQRIRRNKQPFGGVQVLFIGDLLQLPPIVKHDEWQILQKHYSSPYFFDALVIKNSPIVQIELEKIFRQNDEAFIQILNNLRNNILEENDLHVLNQHYDPSFESTKKEGYITLTTHNVDADTINFKALNEINEISMVYQPEIIGDFPERIFPFEEPIELKLGAQVMFIKNDLSPEKRYYNGKIGRVCNLEQDSIEVDFPEENFSVAVDKYTWKNVRFTIDENTKKIEEEILGTYIQYPLKLAWAITVHKSQGLTFEKAALDISRVFAPGQAYVALSRLRSLKGLVLLNKLKGVDIPSSSQVVNYSKNKSSESALAENLESERFKYLSGQLMACFDLESWHQEWRNYKFSFKEEAHNSPKVKFFNSATILYDKILEILEPSRKFKALIHKIFQAENLDLIYLDERCTAAFKYFYAGVEAIHIELLKQIVEVKKLKRVKAFTDELDNLDSLTTEIALKLLGSKVWLKAIIEHRDITKDSFTTSEIVNYKTRLLEELKFNPSVPKKKIKKGQSIDETLELWHKLKSISEVAAARGLVNSTIYSHLTQAIKLSKISAKDIFPIEFYDKIAKIVILNNDKTNGEIIELTEGKYTYDELRMIRTELEVLNVFENQPIK